MSNYTNLKTTAALVATKAETLRLADIASQRAEKDFTQDVAAYETIHALQLLRAQQATDSLAELNALTAEQSALAATLPTLAAGHTTAAAAAAAGQTAAATAETTAAAGQTAVATAAVAGHTAVAVLAAARRALYDTRVQLEGEEAQLALHKKQQADAGGVGGDTAIDALVVASGATVDFYKAQETTDEALVVTEEGNVLTAEGVITTAIQTLRANEETRDNLRADHITLALAAEDAQNASENAINRNTILTSGVTGMNNIASGHSALAAALVGPGATALADKTAATSAKTAATVAKTAAKSSYDSSRAQLTTYVNNQRELEVDAAFSLLEEFFQNGSIVVSGVAPTSQAVIDKIAETCPDSKVRMLFEEMRTSYTSEAEYIALRTEICANPTEALFEDMNDPCFAVLSAAEFEVYRNQVIADFNAKARSILSKYCGTASSGTSTSTMTMVLIILAILAVLAGLFLYLRA